MSDDITSPEQGAPEERPGEADAGSGAGGPGRRGAPTWLKVVGGAVVVAAVGGGAYWFGRNDTGADSTAPATIDTPAGDAGDAGDAPEAADAFDPDDVVEFHDPETGIRLSYPASWTPLELSDEDPSLRLILSAGGLDSVLARVIPLEGTVETEEELADMNAVTDGIISSADVRILEERPIELNGLAGYYYLYLFTDPGSGEEGVHAHYFLFEGDSMYVLVFQAVPTDNFDVLAPAFDVIADSFRVETEGDG